MNRDDVIRMAREAHLYQSMEYHAPGASALDGDDGLDALLEQFAHLIASHVAEECAKAADLAQEYGEDAGEAIRSLYKPTA